MSRRLRQVLALLAATVTMGLTAGFFFAWDVSVMPGLTVLDDRTFVVVFQALDRAIMTSPLFMIAFIGALVFTGLAAILYRRDSVVRRCVVVAFGLYLATVVVTMAVHEPLNMVVRTAGADVAAVREEFHETRWVVWNILRTVATTAAFGCLGWALVLHGRTTAPAADDLVSREVRTAPRPPPGAAP